MKRGQSVKVKSRAMSYVDLQIRVLYGVWSKNISMIWPIPMLKVRVKLAEFSWHDLTYFGPRYTTKANKQVVERHFMHITKSVF